jgi:hypothetical protein
VISLASAPTLRQQLADAVFRTRKQPLQYLLEASPQIVPAPLGRLHQAHHHRSALTGKFTAAEEPL